MTILEYYNMKQASSWEEACLNFKNRLIPKNEEITIGKKNLISKDD